MDKRRRPFASTDSSEFDDPAMAAESVRSDFGHLVSMLDQQLTNLAGTDERARAHILEAKAAAQRGLILSVQLIDLLRVVN